MNISWICDERISQKNLKFLGEYLKKDDLK